MKKVITDFINPIQSDDVNRGCVIFYYYEVETEKSFENKRASMETPLQAVVTYRIWNDTVVILTPKRHEISPSDFEKDRLRVLQEIFENE